MMVDEKAEKLLLKGDFSFVKSWKEKLCQYWSEKSIEWRFRPLSRVFHSYYGYGSHYSCISWISPALGCGSEVPCTRTLSRKKPRGSNPPRTQDSRITIQTLSHAGPRWSEKARKVKDPSVTAIL